jgi:hypothetical protein
MTSGPINLVFRAEMPRTASAKGAKSPGSPPFGTNGTDPPGRFCAPEGEDCLEI